MKKNGLIVLLFIFGLMLILNIFTPLCSDDYYSAFLWPQGLRINDTSVEAIKRVSGIGDIIAGLKGYYYTWGGRVPGGFPVSFFIWQGKEYFNIINAFMMTILVAEIYWLSHEGKITSDFNASYLVWIFFALWAFNVSFIDTCLWLAGSCNYLWMLVIVLAFLIPYVRNCFDDNKLNNDTVKLITGMFFLGLLAGWSHETTNCWIVLMLFYLLYESKKKDKLYTWKVSGFAGFCLGYALLVFAPGNFARLRMQQNSDSLIIASELLSAKLVELVIIFFFHLIVWYFIVSFVVKFKKRRKEFFHKDSGLYLTLSKLFVFIACGSGFLMFFIPSQGFRPSFLNLVYLIIASALLFRLQEVNGAYVINERGKLFLKMIGYAYLTVTIIFSLWGNYINYCHLQSILDRVKEARKQRSEIVLEVPPSLTSQNGIWFFGSGFHLVPLPISEEENYEINKTFSYYYGIKGIRIVK